MNRHIMRLPELHRIALSHPLRGVTRVEVPVVPPLVTPEIESFLHAAADEVTERPDDDLDGPTPEELAAREAEEQRRSQQMAAAVGLLESIEEHLRELEERRKRSLDELQQVAVELAMLVASRLLMHEIEAGEFPIDALVRAALDRLGGDQAVTVHLHPDDIQVFDRLRSPPAAAWPDTLRIVPDTQLERGSCLAQAGDLGLLSTWRNRVEEIQISLLEGIEHAQAERRRTRNTPDGMRRFPDRRETA